MKEVILRYVADSDRTIEDIVKNEFYISSRLLRKLKLNKRISCNNISVPTRYVTEKGDKVEINISFSEESDNIISEERALNILYEDDSLLIVNKPKNVVVHPTCLHPSGTLANHIKFYLETKNEFVTTRFVNRLDRETSGIVIFAKNQYSQEILAREMSDGTFEKEYVAIVHGILCKKSGTIDLPIKRKEGSIMLRTVGAGGKPAVTHYKVIKEFKDTSLIILKLDTGRTHQIRVHLKHIGHPIVGDGLYSEDKGGNGHELHAFRVKFMHPVTKELMEIESKEAVYETGKRNLFTDTYETGE